MHRHCIPRFLTLIAVVTAGLVGACSTLPLSGSLPTGVELARLTKVEGGTPFAWSADGRRVAYVREGVRVRELGSEAEISLNGPIPTALTWSPDGSALALAFTEGEKTRLQLRPLVANGIQAETLLPGIPSALFWTERGIVTCTSTLQRYSFGGNLLTQVARWDGVAAPQLAALHDVTLKPLTLRDWGGILPALQTALSPWGDALLHTRLHDPPEFPPYLKLVWRHLDSGEERVLADVNLLSGGGRFVGSDDQIVVADGLKETRRINLWDGRIVDVLPVPGKVLAASPGGRHLLVDGQLWQDGTLLLTLRDVEAAAFSPQGDRLLLRVGSSLYLLSGLPPDPLPALPSGSDLDKQLLLRRWRALGLISPEEFNQQKGSRP